MDRVKVKIDASFSSLDNKVGLCIKIEETNAFTLLTVTEWFTPK